MKTIILSIILVSSLFSASENVIYLNKDSITTDNYTYVFNPEKNKCEKIDDTFCDKTKGVKEYFDKSSCNFLSHKSFKSGVIIDCLNQEGHIFVFGESEQDCRRTAVVEKLNLKFIQSKIKKEVKA